MTAAGERTAEKKPSLWLLVVSPATWAAHLLASYVTVAIWCAKIAARAESLGAARVAVAAYTAVALAVVIVTAIRGHRLHRAADPGPPHDDDSTVSRRGFMGLATLLLSLLSAVAIVYGALPIVYVGSCR